MDKANAEPSAAEQCTGSIKEAVCINAMRVYDSCSSKEDTGLFPEVKGSAVFSAGTH